MKLKDKYDIRPIDTKIARETVTKYHYLHRAPIVEQAFGLFDREQKITDGVLEPIEKMVGVIIYGTPASPSLRKLCGDEHVSDVIELSRLWIEDDTPKNVESYLVGNTLSKVHKPIIVSYADTGYGHRGIIYQATNFIYTGLSNKSMYTEIDGIKKHDITLLDTYGSVENMKKIFGDRVKKVPATRKHRYIYFNCSGGKKKYFMSKLKYPILPYPKNDSFI
jgi:hypothetical protein